MVAPAKRIRDAKNFIVVQVLQEIKRVLAPVVKNCLGTTFRLWRNFQLFYYLPSYQFSGNLYSSSHQRGSCVGMIVAVSNITESSDQEANVCNRYTSSYYKMSRLTQYRAVVTCGIYVVSKS